MRHRTYKQYFDTVVIGGGQAGLAIGYFLARQDRDFVILDAGGRVGETWRNRWDSLRLFTPAFHDGLPGMPFPAPGSYFPTKDETADYLEAYAREFALPVRFAQHVDSLARHDDGYLVSAGYERYVTEHVVVGTGPYQHPKIPGFAASLDPEIVQLHSSAYRNPDQLPEADVLVVGVATRELRSPWISLLPATRSSPDETPDTYPSASSTIASPCGWPTTCSPPTPGSVGR
jgi:putative flavoprotein involved in K+ transport